MDISLVGPALLGAAVGWTMYYFIRRYTLFSPAALTSTISAIAGGPILKLLDHGPRGDAIQSYYFFGVGIGFFFYAAYLGFLLLMVAKGNISDNEFGFFAGCGGTPRSQKEFKKIIRAVDDHKAGKLDDKQLRRKTRRAAIDRTKFEDLAEDSAVLSTPKVQELVVAAKHLGLEKELPGHKEAWFFRPFKGDS